MRTVKRKENKDYKIRYLNYRLEPKIVVLNSVVSNRFLDSRIRVFARYEIFKISSRNSFPNNFSNRCLLTGRIRATIPEFKLSRIEFRRLAKGNRLIGIRKSSWLLYFLYMS